MRIVIAGGRLGCRTRHTPAAPSADRQSTNGLKVHQIVPEHRFHSHATASGMRIAAEATENAWDTSP